MYVSIPSDNGRVGDRQKHNGLTYEKTKNGKWLLVRDRALRTLLADLHGKQKKTLRQIHTETGIPHSTIQKALNDMGLMRSKKAYSTEFTKFADRNLDKLKRMYIEKGMTFSEIANKVKEKTGRDYPAFMYGRYFKKLGIETRSHAEGIALATLAGKRHKIPKGHQVFASSAIRGWNDALEKPLKDLSPKQYKIIVQRFTKMVIKRFPHLFPPEFQRDLQPMGHHIDHMFSVSSGYYELRKNVYVERKCKVPLEVICHPVNLQVIHGSANVTKGSRNSFDLEELHRRIAKFEKKHGDIFDDYYGQFTCSDIVSIHKRIRVQAND